MDHLMLHGPAMVTVWSPKFPPVQGRKSAKFLAS